MALEILGVFRPLDENGKVKSHSWLAVGTVNARIPLVSMDVAYEEWCPSSLPLLPKPSQALLGEPREFSAHPIEGDFDPGTFPTAREYRGS